MRTQVNADSDNILIQQQYGIPEIKKITMVKLSLESLGISLVGTWSSFTIG
ncbi:hypothetical protein QO062_09635 [Fervidobacterium pennivorans subsp. carthaginiensis]|uniref:hypothetical protein n=1 Tax=Fervidobacterium pennivorans TaxID=93466 RepID=UPI00355C1C07